MNAAIENAQEIRVDFSQVPNFRRIELAKAARNLVELVFSQPGEEEKFQEWRRERRKKTEVNG